MSAEKTMHLLDLPESDLVNWRSQPISQLLIKFLEQEQARALEHIALMVDENKFDEAKITRGGLNLVRTILSALHPSERPLKVVEEPFVDPADIRTKGERDEFYLRTLSNFIDEIGKRP